MLEIALFQKLTLYLGNPVASTSVLLFSLLLGVGLGSLGSSRITHRLCIAVVISSGAVFALSLAYNYVMEDLMGSVAGVITAMIIGIEWGFTEVLFIGGVLYLITGLLFTAIRGQI